MIKAIIFDFFGVLCSNEFWRSVKADNYEASDFKKIADSVNLGHLSWQNFLEEVASKTRKSVDQLQRMYEAEQINLPLAAYIKELRGTYKTALLTNSSSEFVRQMLTRTELEDIFDEVIISSEVGAVKPDPRIYQYAVNKLKVGAGDAVFVDD